MSAVSTSKVIRSSNQICSRDKKTDDKDDDLMMLLCCLSPGVDPWPRVIIDNEDDNNVVKNGVDDDKDRLTRS